MRRLTAFISPWALVGVMAWALVMIAVNTWAIDNLVFANVAQYGLCATPPPECPPPWWKPDPGARSAAAFAIFVAGFVIVALAAIGILVRSGNRTKRMAQLLLVAGTVAVTVALATKLLPAAVFPNAVTYVCDTTARDHCTVESIRRGVPRKEVGVAGLVTMAGGIGLLALPHLARRLRDPA